MLKSKLSRKQYKLAKFDFRKYSNPFAYYQNVMRYSVYIEAHRSNAMFKCDMLRSIFRAAPW